MNALTDHGFDVILLDIVYPSYCCCCQWLWIHPIMYFHDAYLQRLYCLSLHWYGWIVSFRAFWSTFIHSMERQFDSINWLFVLHNLTLMMLAREPQNKEVVLLIKLNIGFVVVLMCFMWLHQQSNYSTNKCNSFIQSYYLSICICMGH